MNYIKKMCILRQIRQGFSGDGKALSGLIKIEQYGKNLAVEVSVINFAPLSSGEYYCLLSDGKGKTEMLALRGKSLFNLLSDLDISTGFCGIICYVKNDVVPIAYGINGNKSYDWRTILNATLPPVFPRSKQSQIHTEIAANEPPMYEVTPQKRDPSPDSAPMPSPKTEEPIMTPPQDAPPSPRELPEAKKQKNAAYNDETVATENYYEENKDERQQSQKISQNAQSESTTEIQGEKKGLDVAKNDDAAHVRRSIKTDPDGYYYSVKEEIDRLFKTYPKDKTLSNAFLESAWVRVKGSAKEPQYLVGVLLNEGKVRYICYALAAEDKSSPPEEIKNVCTFVPVSVYDDTKGFFVIFQSAATGECVRPEIS